MPELASKHKSSNCRPFENINIHWDGLQFVCVSLSQSLLKTTSYPIADHAEMLILVETFFNFYALAYDFKTELRRCSLGRGHELNENFMPAAVLLDSPKMRTLRALTAHSPRTHCALKKWCNVAQKPMELHFIYAASGTSGSWISCFVLHTLRRCQEPKLIAWEC